MAEDHSSIQSFDMNCRALSTLGIPNPTMTSSQWSLLIGRQNALVSHIQAQGCQIIAEVGLLALRIERAASLRSATLNPDRPPPSDRITRVLCGSSPRFKFQLCLESELPTPLYKERAFRLEVRVQDLDGNPAALAEPLVFRIVFFTSEETPKLLTANKSGQHLLTGSTAQGRELVVFRKVVLNEVSSHFEGGTLCLAIAAERGSVVKPLVIDGVVIKARKSLIKGTHKKSRRLEQ